MIEVYLALMFAAIAAVAAIVAIRAAHAAQSTGNALAGKLMRHQMLVEEQEALRERVNKLAGRFYRTVRTEREAEKPETPDEVRARLRTEHGLPKMGRSVVQDDE